VQADRLGIRAEKLRFLAACFLIDVTSASVIRNCPRRPLLANFTHALRGVMERL
jgi:hypothetical protein